MQNSIEERFVRSAFAAPDTILVATDLNDMHYLVPHAVVQARASRASLTFVHAIQAEEMSAGKGFLSTLGPLKRDRDARLEMEIIARQVREQGIECTTAVRHGSVVDVILEMVEQTGAGRLIAGTHAKSELKRLRFGSILLRLLRHLDIPVCVIGPHAHPESSQPTLRTILHPISLSGAYERSAALAVALAQYCKAMLTLMHVFDPDRGSQITIGPSALNNLVPGDDLCPPILTTETVGHVVPEVLRVANEIQADMIVLDVHADSFFRSPQGESTAYEIIVSATCPVLVLKVNPELVPVSLVATELAPMFSVA